MTEQLEIDDVAYLRHLAERVFRIPVMHGVDQGDTDALYYLARRLEDHLRSTKEPDQQG